MKATRRKRLKTSGPALFCTGPHRTARVSREGLEPSTRGLTYRTGSRPPCALRSGLYHLPRRQAGREPLVKSLRIPAAPIVGFRSAKARPFAERKATLARPPVFPADCPIRRIVTPAFARRRTDGSQGVPAYGAVLPWAFRPGHSYLKSAALPTELPALNDRTLRSEDCASRLIVIHLEHGMIRNDALQPVTVPRPRRRSVLPASRVAPGSCRADRGRSCRSVPRTRASRRPCSSAAPPHPRRSTPCTTGSRAPS